MCGHKTGVRDLDLLYRPDLGQHYPWWEPGARGLFHVSVEEDSFEKHHCREEVVPPERQPFVEACSSAKGWCSGGTIAPPVAEHEPKRWPNDALRGARPDTASSPQEQYVHRPVDQQGARESLGAGPGGARTTTAARDDAPGTAPSQRDEDHGATPAPRDDGGAAESPGGAAEGTPRRSSGAWEGTPPRRSGGESLACLAPVVYHHEHAIMVNQSHFLAPYCDDFAFFVANRSAPALFNGYDVHNLDIIADEWQLCCNKVKCCSE